MSTPLTVHLVSLATPRPYSAATQHAFLTAAGTGTLSPGLLSLYLSQDRIYAAQGYPRLLGLLLVRVPLSSTDPTRAAHGEQIVRVLADALQNVLREASMFDEIVQAHGLPLLATWRERKATRDYTAEMVRVGASGTFEDGLVFLWAMERVYLDAWKYVKSLLPSVSEECASPAHAAIKKLVDNWTCPEFEQFVETLAGIVNGLGIQPGEDSFKHTEEIWFRVVELEEAFWPNPQDVQPRQV